jgi:hypothetical protein
MIYSGEFNWSSELIELLLRENPKLLVYLTVVSWEKLKLFIQNELDLVWGVTAEKDHIAFVLVLNPKELLALPFFIGEIMSAVYQVDAEQVSQLDVSSETEIDTQNEELHWVRNSVPNESQMVQHKVSENGDNETLNKGARPTVGEGLQLEHIHARQRSIEDYF